MSELTAPFYKTKLWQDCRRSYIKKVGGLCEICLANGIIKHGDTVHHKIHLTAANMTDPQITLNFDNLQLVCRDCHAKIHHKTQKRYKVADDGRILTPSHSDSESFR